MTNAITPINSSDKSWTRHRYVLAFGAYGDTRLLVWANSLDDALDECVDWIADNAPGLLADDQVAEEYERLMSEGKTCTRCWNGAYGDDVGECLDCKGEGIISLTEEEAHEEATIDTTCAGNCGNYILSHEWMILAEDPDRATMLALLGRH